MALLHENDLSPSDIADILDEDVKIVTHHLRELYDAGCIEFVGHKGTNLRRAVYRAVSRVLVTDEAYRAMSIEERNDLNGVALQWIMAECLISHRSGRMNRDENLCLLSDEPNLDSEGRRELRDFLRAAWEGVPDVLQASEGIQEIECRAANRMAKSGEGGTKIFVALLAFERGR